MSRLLIVLILSFIFTNLSEGRHERKHAAAVLVGTVYCDTCFEEEFTSSSHFISDALLIVECGGTISKPNFRKEVKTNAHGKFKVHLPLSVSKHVKRIKGCSVKLISSSEPNCAVASSATSSSLHLKSKREGTHIFSAGFFSFKPLKQPSLCNQKPSIQNSKKVINPMKSFDPSFTKPMKDSRIPNQQPTVQDQAQEPLPELPKLSPLPELTPLPTLPRLPFPPSPVKKLAKESLKTYNTQTSNDRNIAAFRFPFPPNPFRPPTTSIFPPNPFQPPSIIPPNPFQPPPSIIPPIFPSPPPSIFPPIFHFPPIPALTPPPPPPPALPIPLPPFPFQPVPGFPGNPPASLSSHSKETTTP